MEEGTDGPPSSTNDNRCACFCPRTTTRPLLSFVPLVYKPKPYPRLLYRISPQTPHISPFHVVDIATDTMSATSTDGPPAATTSAAEGARAALESSGISLVAFVTALAASLVVFGIQMGFFLLLRNKLARILYVPTTYPRLLTAALPYDPVTDVPIFPANQKPSSYPNANEQTRHPDHHGTSCLRL